MTRDPQNITLVGEPRGDAYRALIREALRYCTRATLIERSTCETSNEAHDVRQRLQPFLRAERQADEWPGTRLIDHTALLREYEFTEGAAAILETAVEGLFDWCQPDRPEDLVLWHRDASPWLVTIAHERDAYLSVTPGELEEICARVPATSTRGALAR